MARRWKSSDIALSSRGTLTAKVSVKAAGSNPVLPARKCFEGLVIGIDPSLRGSGIALIRCTGGTFTLLHSQTLKTKGTHTAALGEIAQAVEKLCSQYRPDAAAIEETIFVQSHKVAITLGTARGAILATLALRQIPVSTFGPTRIKQAIVGHGRASKPQIAAMTQRLLKLSRELPHDEADAAAAALCFALTYRDAQ